MNRLSALDAAKAAVAGRADEYSGPEDSFAAVAALWDTYWSAQGRDTFAAHDVAIFLTLLKVARLAANPTHADSWIDIAGYAACGAEIMCGDHVPDAGKMVRAAPKCEECHYLHFIEGAHFCGHPSSTAFTPAIARSPRNCGPGGDWFEPKEASK